MLSEFAPATLTISLDAIAANYNLVKSKTAAAVAGMLKADAYGTGVQEVCRTLRDQGCRHFFVATPDEAEQLRNMDPDSTIYVLDGLQKGTEDFFAAKNIIPVLNTFAEIERYAKFAGDKKLPAVLNFDTGMNRLGLGTDETPKLLDDLSILAPLDLKLVMSHFACSDEKDHPKNAAQAEAFAVVAKRFSDVPKSLANSSAIFRDKNWHYDMVRPGYALYGGNPLPEVSNPMRNVVSLDAQILQTRNIRKGETVGYNATFTAPKDMTMITLGLGYADGFSRSGGNLAQVYYNGQACPVIGRISMDLITADVTHVTGKPPKAGDQVEILGPHQDIDTLASGLGTIGYEFLTCFARRRYRRVYA